MTGVRPIRKVLIANRGEIAVRIIRCCHDMGLRTVAVYSDVDRTAYHVRLADEAYHIGPAPSRESYLVGEKIISVARESGADAIHPGYGFLSENARFATMCADAGIVFIGPRPETIALLGDKIAARRTALKAGLPLAPAVESENPTFDSLRASCDKIGYPVLIKAAAGGGGKGMRIAASAADLTEALESAAREAGSAFGDSRIYVEKYLERPRHVEIQIFGDAHGNVAHLFERECSIQRRHQKVIEEAPSTILDTQLRDQMGAAAVAIAKESGYVGAGTVEFLVDKDRKFYFLEVNTRLQVEHPVTELITGIDLVREQIRVAEGHALSFRQQDLRINGWAIESRIYAEDPDNNFMPSTGVLHSYRQPAGPGVRVDAGVVIGSEISVYYDPMIAKLAVWGSSRDEAIERSLRALSEYRVSGVSSTTGFARTVLDSAAFRRGNLSTSFLADNFPGGVYDDNNAERLEIAAIAAAIAQFRAEERVNVSTNGASPVARENNQSATGWKMRGRRDALRARTK